MSNRTISDENVMRERWDKLIAAMDEQEIDCLLMYSAERVYSGYLRYVTDCPVSLYPLSGLFSKKAISMVGHGVKDIPLYPVPVEKQTKGLYQFHAGGVVQHDFAKDLVGVPACPTTIYAPNLWAKALGELIKKYDYKRIGLVGTNIIPVGFVQCLSENMPELEFVDATQLVDEIKSQKSAYEIMQAEKCIDVIDELMSYAKIVIRPGENLRTVGKKLRAAADDLDCLDLNIMLGKHSTMPMFSEWMFTDEEILMPEDCVELMVEVSSNKGFWGECARVYSMETQPEELKKTVNLAFKMQHYAADLLKPGEIPSDIFEKYCSELVKNGFSAEKRFFCHGQGYDVVETPFIRPENKMPLKENAVIAVHPSMYDPIRKTGCFVCDNYLLTNDGAKLMNKTPQMILQTVY